MSILEKNIIKLYGEKGKQWLNNLPQFVQTIKSAFNLSDLKPVQNLSYNYVMSGFQYGQPVILKLSLNIEQLKQEALALKHLQDLGLLKYWRKVMEFFC
jgi:streptomycin 6-kinase